MANCGDKAQSASRRLIKIFRHFKSISSGQFSPCNETSGTSKTITVIVLKTRLFRQKDTNEIAIRRV